jgi:hypothetical protein
VPRLIQDCGNVAKCVGANLCFRSTLNGARRAYGWKTNIGARDFQELTIPGLELLGEGALPNPTMRFPPEVATYHSHSPSISQAIFALHASAIPTEEDAPTRDHRIIMLNGDVIATLPSPPLGLTARGDQAVVRARSDGSIELVLCCLRTGTCLQRLVLQEATEACIRIHEHSILVGDDLGRIFRIL